MHRDYFGNHKIRIICLCVCVCVCYFQKQKVRYNLEGYFIYCSVIIGPAIKNKTKILSPSFKEDAFLRYLKTVLDSESIENFP